MREDIDLNTLKEIYLVSNTAPYLYTNFSRNENVQFLSSKFATEELVREFKDLANSEINEIDELVWAYVLYVAILIKADDSTFDFIRSSGNINFEWFGELSNIFSSRFKPDNRFVFLQNPSEVKLNRINQKTESSAQVIELS